MTALPVVCGWVLCPLTVVCRPAGVHGALLVHEPRFTGELLAAVLSIPAGKSLLRRHLFTRFSELVGQEVLRQKREVEDNQSIAPLRPDSKVKVRPKGSCQLGIYLVTVDLSCACRPLNMLVPLSNSFQDLVARIDCSGYQFKGLLNHVRPKSHIDHSGRSVVK